MPRKSKQYKSRKSKQYKSKKSKQYKSKKSKQYKSRKSRKSRNYKKSKRTGNKINSSNYDCSKLKHVIIPDGTTIIDSNTFKDCIELTQITIPEGVISIGNNAFENCIKLKSIILPDSIISIGDNAFRNCVKLNYVHCGLNLKEIGKEAFARCMQLFEISIPSSIDSIGIDPFSDIKEHQREMMITFYGAHPKKELLNNRYILPFRRRLNYSYGYWESYKSYLESYKKVNNSLKFHDNIILGDPYKMYIEFRELDGTTYQLEFDINDYKNIDKKINDKLPEGYEHGKIIFDVVNYKNESLHNSPDLDVGELTTLYLDNKGEIYVVIYYVEQSNNENENIPKNNTNSEIGNKTKTKTKNTINGPEAGGK